MINIMQTEMTDVEVEVQAEMPLVVIAMGLSSRAPHGEVQVKIHSQVDSRGLELSLSKFWM
jgi:hypothetical protein